MQDEAKQKTVVFLDETWANAHDGKDLAWVEDDAVTGGTLGGVRRPSGKGKRFILLGVGSEMGWVPNTTLIFQSKKDTGDYHDEMTGEHFEEWFHEKLLPNIPPNSLIAMDNHRQLQNFETTQAKIEGWGLLGVEIGVVLIIYGCVHFANGSCTCFCFFSQVSFTSILLNLATIENGRGVYRYQTNRPFIINGRGFRSHRMSHDNGPRLGEACVIWVGSGDPQPLHHPGGCSPFIECLGKT